MALGRFLLHGLAVLLLLAGCVPLTMTVSTRAPLGATRERILQDESQCEAYAKSNKRHHDDHYRTCMASRDYATNMDVQGVGWHVPVIQTRPHEPIEIYKDMDDCGYAADSLKDTDVIPPIPPDQEKLIAPYANGERGLETPGKRPRAAHMLVACLNERGYKVTQYVN